MDILDDMGVSKLSAKVFWKVNYSSKDTNQHEVQKGSFLKFIFILAYRILRMEMQNEKLG